MVSLTSISLNNSLGIITIDDNRVHKYFTDISWEKDNDTPVGYAKAKIPYNQELLKYWTKYNGMIVIHAQLLKTASENKTFSELPNTSLVSKSVEEVKIEQTDDKIEITNKEYNYSFIGHIHRVKQIGQNIIISFNDVGWKFMQKVPADFRKSFIAGQSLDDAFQAICEFIGVDFAYSIEDLNQYNFAADGYSIEKDGTIIEEVPDILSEYKASKDEEETNADEDMANDLDSGMNESGSLPKYVNENKVKNNINQTTNNLSFNQSVTDNLSNNEETEENTEETNTINDKIEKYQENFTEKIRDLFIGNTIYNSNVTDAVLNYDAITIQPKAVTSSNMSTESSANNNSNTSNSDNNSNNETNSNNTTSTSNGGGVKNGWIKGQYYINNKIYLSKEYINTLSIDEAKAKLKNKNVYTKDTRQKLLWRSMGVHLR